MSAQINSNENLKKKKITLTIACFLKQRENQHNERYKEKNATSFKCRVCSEIRSNI
jgi:hypothetical protein